MRGRKNKPTILRVIDGKRDHRPINKNEPATEWLSNDPPACLTRAQRVLWRRALRSVPPGLLGEDDKTLLMVWCVTQDHYSTAVAMQAKLDLSTEIPLLVLSKSGDSTESPYLRLMHKHAGTLVRVAAELGFSPSTRAKMSAPHRNKKESDPATNLFGF